MDKDLIISVKEFRRLTGSTTANFSDEQIADFIQHFDFLARMYLNTAVIKKEVLKESNSNNKQCRLPKEKELGSF